MEREEIMNVLGKFDLEMTMLAKQEEERQRSTINIIASENFASPLSTCLEGGIWANKNAEGYPGKRFVAGCELVDRVENLAIERLKELFQCEYANVQAMSATVGNVAIMNAVLKPGDTILSMELSHGGHLSHGASFHYSGKTFNAIHYGVNRETEQIDMDEVRRLAIEHKPKMIICGTSSYPRLIDYAAFSEIAKSVGAVFFVDLAHNVGLVAAGAIPSPVPYADIVSSSTHKTFRGPRGGGIILCKKELAGKIDRALFPGLQGAAKMDMIAARAVLFKECMTKEFKRYGKQVIANAVALANGCLAEGLRLVAGGTETHLVVVDVTNLIPTGKQAEEVLASIGIICNKNGIPFDSQPLTLASGIRIGSPFMTTRGMKEKEMFQVGTLVGQALRYYNDAGVLDNIRKKVADLAARYPLFADEWMPKAN
ncbi:serine hydroxymethyltransferase [Sporomusa sp. KB1]|jgi:glycine hydroxymethyltransferase|uniref:serine hydroxymethyltransferase n=1 Tax=Sporomusa sp. KB1 TaxID=943346 RepID=UPI0011ADA744|nr:serine hydroxymethyltransferase [Sporomusa sp. KB1]TWH45801.1 serine hydroxymethyltransferase [Sporomusa sp. KB1]